MQSSVKPSRLSLARRESLWAYAFIAPWTIGFIIFTVGPMLASLFFSFTEYDIVSPPKWIGLTNYINLIHDDLFWHSLGITFKYAVIALPLGTRHQLFDCCFAQPKDQRDQYLAYPIFSSFRDRRGGSGFIVGAYLRPQIWHTQPIPCTIWHQRPRLAFRSPVGNPSPGDHELVGRGRKHNYLSGWFARRAHRSV